MSTGGGTPRVYIHGRSQGVTRRRLAARMNELGLGHATKPSEADTIVVAYGTASKVGHGLTVVLPRGSRFEAAIRSEGWLKRHLGLSPPLPDAPRTLPLEDVARAAKLPVESIVCLGAYDLIEPVDGLCSFGDLRASREVARLLEEGFDASRIVQAALQLRRSGQRLSDTRLTMSAEGSIAQEVEGARADLLGQIALPFHESGPTIDEIFERAEMAEAAGHLAEAERWYRLAGKLDRADPVIPFNLGNVLDEQGRTDEAILAYQEAIGRDPTFPEAWYNLGLVSKRRQEFDRARSCLEAAVTADPAYQDAAYALARLLTETERFVEAIPAWSRYINLRPAEPNLGRAQRYLKLCRLSVVATG